ncbi:MAG: nucleotidyltransferase [bacterium]|nr:nucleotidyltransferase [bacterium]
MTSLADLNDDFRDLLLALVAEGVEFVIVGAYALALHGVPRFTGDLDVFVRPGEQNSARLWSALTRFGAPLQAAGISPRDFATPGLVYQIGLPPRRIDLLTEISGVTFDDAWATREPATIDGHRVDFIGRDALVRNKLAAGRPKDLADAGRLKR